MSEEKMARMKAFFGDEYPAALTHEGVRLPIASESRWKRTYEDDERKFTHVISRFMDGSASIGFPEFVREWAGWDEEERRDFCGSCSWLRDQSDFPDMLRHMMQHGGPEVWTAIANSVGDSLPQGEALDLLTRALNAVELEDAVNISQGISHTKHSEAEHVLRDHLATLWSHPSLWDDDPFLNWLAYGATCCIAHLIDLGATPQDFREQVRALATHPCGGNRASCRSHLAKHYSWLEDAPERDG